MSREIIPDKALDALRQIGDPALDELVKKTDFQQLIISPVQERGLMTVVEESLGDRQLAGLVQGAVASEPRILVDADRILSAQQLFARYGTEIASALLLAALPQAYAANKGSKVLVATAELESNLARRIGGTAQFLVTIMTSASDADTTKSGWTVPRGDELRQLARHRLPAQHGQARNDAAPAVGRIPPWLFCLALRIYHAAVRAKLQDDERYEDEFTRENLPLNQEDLLGMLLSFSITTFEVLERYGIVWTRDEQEDYLYLWDMVGSFLGVGSPAAVAHLESHRDQTTEPRPPAPWAAGCNWVRKVRVKVWPPKSAPAPEVEALEVATIAKAMVEAGLDPRVVEAAYGPRPITSAQWHGLRPPSIDESRALLQQIQQRQWPEVGPSAPGKDDPIGATAGRRLTRALITELADAMPPTRRRLPLVVMRQLNPEIVCDRLALGAGGAALTALELLSRRRVLTEPFTVYEATGPLAGKVLRALGNEVTRRLTLMYLREGRLVVPGLDLSAAGTARFASERAHGARRVGLR